MLQRKYQGLVCPAGLLWRAGHAIFVVLLLASVWFAQFAATNHELSVRHAICPQHGEVVDLDDAALATGLQSESSQDTQVSFSSDSPFEGHHQHCLFVSTRGTRDAIALLADPVADKTVTVDFSVSRPPDTSARISPALYLAAPKHSPPLA